MSQPPGPPFPALDLTDPALSDLRRRARRRMPRFVWDYLDSGTGEETLLRRNRAALDAVTLMPSVLHGDPAPRISTRLLGHDLAAPFGIAPLGMSGLIWPDAERSLAAHAAAARIPYCLSTVATQTPEALADRLGGMGWFQLYSPRDAGIRRDILRRARMAGFHTLVVTLDVPVMSRRERQRRAQLSMPPRVTPGMLAQVATCPAWAWGILRHGRPRLRLMEGYARAGGASTTARADHDLRCNPDADMLAALRQDWDGPLVVKGVLDATVAALMKDAGMDAVWVSNHGGRQFDAAPTPAEVMPQIRAAVGPDYPLIFDSGVEGGLDILRALALGADFVMLGRAWHIALAALGRRGPAHLHHILAADLIANMGQIGARRLRDIPGRLWQKAPQPAR